MSELILTDALSIRDEDAREIEARIVPWDTVTETAEGLESFRRGAFSDTDPQEVTLRMDHQDPAGGRGVSIEDRDDGAYMVLRADRSPRGDQILASAREGTYRHVSVGFEWVKGGYKSATKAGRRVTVHTKALLREVSPTWRPAYREAAILAVRNEGEDMTEATEPTTEAAPVAPAETAQITQLQERLDALEERNRQAATISQMVNGPMTVTQERRVVAERALADIITTGNEGVVPDAFTTEMIGIIDSTRPFLQSTRQLPTPTAGMNLLVPKITQRPLVDKQTAEKAEVASRATIIGTAEFPFETHAGAADLSLQLIKRSSPEFLNLWLELLGEAYAIDTDADAVAALLAGGVTAGTAVFSPDDGNISFGEAFTNSQAVSPRMFPDTLWVSTPAIAQLIDAKTDGTNTPMFGSLQLNADANGGVTGTVSGLRAVHVPSLDATAVDAIVGPRRGFAWAEDGTYTLQADVPAKAGRDVGIVGMIAYAPWYPSAFTTYALAI